METKSRSGLPNSGPTGARRVIGERCRDPGGIYFLTATRGFLILAVSIAGSKILLTRSGPIGALRISAAFHWHCRRVDFTTNETGNISSSKFERCIALLPDSGPKELSESLQRFTNERTTGIEGITADKAANISGSKIQKLFDSLTRLGPIGALRITAALLKAFDDRFKLDVSAQ